MVRHTYGRFGDGETSTEENPYHKYLNPGSYTVSLIATSSDGCIDSAVLDTQLKLDGKQEVSNPLMCSSGTGQDRLEVNGKKVFIRKWILFSGHSSRM